MVERARRRKLPAQPKALQPVLSCQALQLAKEGETKWTMKGISAMNAVGFPILTIMKAGSATIVEA